ncbi:PREDICTED: zinc finger BED domain-containing protein 4-like [Amphimedon queenslandica]|uniref:BED-type domain-containing protein n=1 Tax=Amphimedon queenslandica TaxID=400682 RepID=A0AAN0ILJ5_AMPQE|nr:PREDICTED: zinc finger BED domain-containing protein 4-like [Amphimedon queenslandica]|eukprot:XP_011403989.1 PREDICTED: zinc finger BED domain-containing protein 4-like [Amphimedon queenslandica]
MAENVNSAATTTTTTVSAPASTESTARKGSDVWKYFKKVNGEAKAKCDICQNLLAYRGRTTNLRDHIVAKHPLFYSPSSNNTTTKTSATTKKTQGTLSVKSKMCSEAESKAITECIFYMICADLSVKLEALHSLLQMKYSTCKGSLRTKLEESRNIALTTDIWPSRAVEAYITVTAHFFDSSWKLNAYVLETTAFPERHTGVEIAAKLQDIVDDFNINSHISVIVHNQTANMLSSLDILDSKRGWKSLNCVAHCLQLCLKPGFEIAAISRFMSPARKFIGHFNHSVVATEALKRKQQQMSTDSNCKFEKLIKDCPTKWNPSFLMLQPDDTVTKRSDRYLDLKGEQWEIASELVKALKPFDVATTFFSYEESPSISCVLPILHGIVQSLSAVVDEPSVIHKFKEEVSGEIKRRWSFDAFTYDTILLLSLMLDPRFKSLSFITDPDIKESIKEEVLSRMEKIKEKERSSKYRD